MMYLGGGEPGVVFGCLGSVSGLDVEERLRYCKILDIFYGNFVSHIHVLPYTGR